ncbi:hypothetical protein K438DRAFT_1991187 [Mycena galopus ATCC 62051]|nr:hypothetical protein K438DRAFT_1991187 [Mycena galopus ATCC 62051]
MAGAGWEVDSDVEGLNLPTPSPGAEPFPVYLAHHGGKLRASSEGTEERSAHRGLSVGNIAFDATEHDVRDVAQFGDVESVRLIINPDGSFRGFGYVTFTSQTAADECLNTGFEIFGRPVRLDYSTPSTPLARRRLLRAAVQLHHRVLFVDTIPYGTEEAALREKLTPFGTIQGIRVATCPGDEFL